LPALCADAGEAGVERFMAKKGAKVALAYFITLIAALLVFGLLLLYLVNNVLFEPSKADIEQTPANVNAADAYVPAESDSQTLLLIVDVEKKLTSNCFIILKTLPTKRELVILTLPGNTYAVVDGAGNSVYEFYRIEGALTAVKAVKNATGLTVDKYLKVNKDSLETLVDIFGGADYDVPYNLVYEDPFGEDIIIKEGRTFLDAELVRKVVTFPVFRGGEQYRARTTSNIAAELVNKNVSGGFYERIDEYFNRLINSDVETNITAYDYREKAASVKYIAQSKDKIAVVVTPSGEDDENGYYRLEQNFVQALISLYSQ
jgi:anionic cell wall polymer biosynthesis LytR-Cps2A-Psr (LCP) family protein